MPQWLEICIRIAECVTLAILFYLIVVALYDYYKHDGDWWPHE